MGDIADSMINGEFDCYTGEYLGSPCGYPRSRTNTHSNYLNTSSKVLQRYIDKRYVNLNIPNVVDEFFIKILKENETVKNMSYKQKAKHVMDQQFLRFAAWLGQEYKQNKK